MSSPTPSHPTAPSLPWRASSTVIMGLTGLISRGFLYGANKTEVHGLEGFAKILDERRDVEGRDRGLVTVSNHISVLDDPLMWGVLPVRHLLDSASLRWGLGSYDICFKNKALSTFFSLGQVLPTHRLAYSHHGGLFQPTLTQCIRLLSSPAPTLSDPTPNSITDPFSSPHLTYSTTGADAFPAPASCPSNRHAWIHIFPEGKIHQHPDKSMRYFKWGVARLILEAEPCPRVVPIYIQGLDGVMHESRPWPRFVPRAGKSIGVWFGDEVDAEGVFGDLRRRWQRLKERHAREEVGELSERLKYGTEAVALREECTRRVRREVLRVRRLAGAKDEDTKAGLVETWRREGGEREGRMEDGSWVREE